MKHYSLEEASRAWGITLEAVKRRLIRAEKFGKALGMKDRRTGEWVSVLMTPEEFDLEQRRMEERRQRREYDPIHEELTLLQTLRNEFAQVSYALDSVQNEVAALRQEIALLRAENELREQTLHHFAVSISRLVSALTPPEERAARSEACAPTPEGLPPEEPHASQPHPLSPS